MRFLVITDAPTLKEDDAFVAYSPYVREMNVWFKYVDDFTIISPINYDQVLLTSKFNKRPKVISLPSIAFNSLLNSIKSIINLPVVSYKIFISIYKADHIHLRCPGNIGLLGCFVQIFFPNKVKTAKYAGNWDPKAKQPISYKLQKWLLSNTALTKKMNVLVYGAWEKQSKNIKPFFTATFSLEEKEQPVKRDYNNILHFVFIGSLVEGKRPLMAIKIIENLKNEGRSVKLNLYGDGVLRGELQGYIDNNGLNDFISLQGNQDIVVLKEVLKKAHFLMLPSKSEGWPKVLAEAMFFGTIPIATKISCIPYMLDYGKRGILINSDLSDALIEINTYLKKEELLKSMSQLGANWSQNYTLETFETEIAKLLNN